MPGNDSKSMELIGKLTKCVDDLDRRVEELQAELIAALMKDESLAFMWEKINKNDQPIALKSLLNQLFIDKNGNVKDKESQKKAIKEVNNYETPGEASLVFISIALNSNPSIRMTFEKMKTLQGVCKSLEDHIIVNRELQTYDDLTKACDQFNEKVLKPAMAIVGRLRDKPLVNLLKRLAANFMSKEKADQKFFTAKSKKVADELSEALKTNPSNSSGRRSKG